MIKMKYHISQGLRTAPVICAIIFSQAINAVNVDVTAKANKCKGDEAVKEVNVTLASSKNNKHMYSFECGKHEANYPPCRSDQQEQQSALSTGHMNNTCVFNNSASERFARSPDDGKCYKVCDSCDGRRLLNNDGPTTDRESMQEKTTSTVSVTKSQSRQTCIEEEDTAEYIMKNSEKEESSEDCKWKKKCQKKTNGTSPAEKAVGMRLRPHIGNRTRLQLYCCKMNCSYNCTEEKFNYIEGETVTTKLNKSEVLTEIQVHKYGKKNGLQMYMVALNKCNECPPGFAAPANPPPVIPVPVLAIGYGDEPTTPFGLCDTDDDCSEGEKCDRPRNSGATRSYCLPSCPSCAPPTSCLGNRFCICSTATCGPTRPCCSGNCVGTECQPRDGPCRNNMECFHAIDQHGVEGKSLLCVDSQCRS